MSFLTREKYRDLFEAVKKYPEMVSTLKDGRVNVEYDERCEKVDELDDVGAAFYRSGYGDFYAVTTHLGEEALEHIEKGGNEKQYLTAMEWKEELFKDVYST